MVPMRVQILENPALHERSGTTKSTKDTKEHKSSDLRDLRDLRGRSPRGSGSQRVCTFRKASLSMLKNHPPVPMRGWMIRTPIPCFVLLLLIGTGCSEQPRIRRAMAQAYQPANLHRSGPTLPDGLRRVAVLPLTPADGSSDAAAAVSTLEPIVLVELRKHGAFDVIQVSREQLRLWTGRPDWRVEEKLPADLLAKVHDKTGSEGVIFAHLSAYRPYPPIAVGWRLSLIECNTGITHWSVDEMFDAGSVEVMKAAQAYARAQMNQPSVDLDSTGVLTSPSRFGQYTAAAVIGTMQKR